MTKMPKTLFMALGFCLVASLAFGQANTGDGGSQLPSDNDITAVPEGGVSILYAPSEADDAAYRAAIAAITGGTVDYFDASAGTPDAALLANYDCVHTWANFAYADNVGYGDNLADYVDVGGRVVLGAFTTFTQGNSLSGRIMDPGYSPVNSPSGGNWFFSSDYAGDGAQCIHDQVTSYECTFRDMLALQGGLQDGSYDDGEIAHSYRGANDFSVVHSNGSGASALGCTGDWARLVANSCNCSSNCVLSARILGAGFSAGDAVKVRLDLQHNKIGTTTRSFRLRLEDQAGNIVAERETPPINLSFGERIRRTYSIRIPAGTPAGAYKVRASISGMQQGHSQSIRPITIGN